MRESELFADIDCNGKQTVGSGRQTIPSTEYPLSLKGSRTVIDFLLMSRRLNSLCNALSGINVNDNHLPDYTDVDSLHVE
jgi:hypothetical protein